MKHLTSTMSSLHFFDCNCIIGRSGVRRSTEISTVNEFVKQMNYFGIKEALVYHFASKEYHPADGNIALSKSITRYKQLHGCWILVPHYTAEMKEPEKLIDEMLKKR